MRTAIYPGSFDPWHAGHDEVLNQALKIFDEVIIAQGVNPDKRLIERTRLPVTIKTSRMDKKIVFAAYKGLFVDFVQSIKNVDAIVKGLRNGQDLEYERIQQYTNEDLAKQGSLHLPPTVFFIAHRDLVHISSSAIRTIEHFKKGSK